MLTMTIPYEDFNGQKKIRTAYFHLSKTEITRMVAIGEVDPNSIEKAVKNKNDGEIFLMLERFIASAYGVKSEDGSRFMKNEEAKKEFMESAAYDVFVMDLVSDVNKAMKFITGIFPKDVANEVIKKMSENKDVPTIARSAEVAADNAIPSDHIVSGKEAPIVHVDEDATNTAFEEAVKKAVEERLRNANLESNGQ